MTKPRRGWVLEIPTHEAAEAQVASAVPNRRGMSPFPPPGYAAPVEDNRCVGKGFRGFYETPATLRYRTTGPRDQLEHGIPLTDQMSSITGIIGICGSIDRTLYSGAER
jgi:hypothetical protein